jgi:hypothetical protein
MSALDLLVLAIHHEFVPRADYPQWYRFTSSQLCEEFLFDVRVRA